MPKGSWLIIFALAIDGLQAAFSLSLLGIGSAVGLIPGVAFASMPLAIALGMVINICISLTMGTALAIGMAFNGMFSLRLGAAFFEVVPGLNNLPVWTIAVLLCIFKKYKEDKAHSIIHATATNTDEYGTTQKERERLGKAVFATRVIQTPEREPQVAPDIKPARQKAALVAGLVLLLLTPSAHAQVAPEPVRYLVAPETPGPNEPVVISIEGVGTFLGDATITWTQNGSVVKQGVGERNFSFMTGALGSRTSITATIKSASEGTLSRTFSFSPSVVTMLWEADTTAPPLYSGKPLYSAGSPLTIVAIPLVYTGGSRVAPSALSYQWSRNDEPMPDSSGLGRSTLRFMGDQLKNAEAIVVDVYWGNARVARGDVVVPVTQPRILLYQYDALRGVIYDSALPQAIALTGKEITFKAEAYHFSNVSKKNNALSYTWTLNDQETTGPDASRGILTLRQAGAGEGSATLSASLQNFDSATFVQTGEVALQILFGAAPSSALGNLFGL